MIYGNQESSDEIEWLNSNTNLNNDLRRPSVSIVLATFNGEQYLGDLLDSLNRQTYAPIEVIVGDDGSSDRTLELISKFANQCDFSVGLRRANAQGSSVNFLSTAKYSSGDWVIFCDQDDVWNENRISSAINEITKDPKLCAVFQSCTICDEDLSPRSQASFPGTHAPGVYAANSLDLPHVWPGFLQVLRRDLVDIAVLSSRPKQQHHCQNENLIAHDRWSFILASMVGKVLVQDVSVAKFRRHSGAQTGLYDGRKNRLNKIRAVSGIRYERYIRLYSHFLTLQAFLRRNTTINSAISPRLVDASSHRYLQCALEAKILSMLLGGANINRLWYWFFVGLSYSRRSKNSKFMNEVVISIILRALRK